MDTPVARFWHLYEPSFGQPKGAVQLQLTNAVCERSARDAVCLRMLLELTKVSSQA